MLLVVWFEIVLLLLFVESVRANGEVLLVPVVWIVVLLVLVFEFELLLVV